MSNSGDIPVKDRDPNESSFRRPNVFNDGSGGKSPALATVMSIVPGLGQVYLGYYQQGFTNIIVVASLITLLAHGIGDVTPLVAIFLVFFWLHNLVDAANRAFFYNQRLARLGPMEVPASFKTLDGRGSVLGGLLMIGFGILAFAHTRFGVSLEWMEQWWPMVLVVTGAWLVLQSVVGRIRERAHPVS